MINEQVLVSRGKLIMLVAVYSVVVMALKIAIMYLAPSGPNAANAEALRQLLAEFGPIGLVIMAGVAVPALEELIFRFVIYNAVTFGATRVLRLGLEANKAGWIGSWIGIIVSAWIFAGVHQETNPAIFYTHFVFGIGAAHLYRRTGTIAAPVLLHMIGNTTLLTLILIFPGL